MKKMIALLIALFMTVSIACAEELYASLNEEAQLCYSAEIAEYVGSALTLDELNAKETLTEDEQAMMEELSLDYLVAHDCGSFGYTYADLDNNGIVELIIAVSPNTDSYFAKLVLEVCTLTEDNDCEPLFASAERASYYWLGGDKFALIASSGADDSVDTTLQLVDGKLVDLETPADPESYQQFDVTEVYPVVE